MDFNEQIKQHRQSLKRSGYDSFFLDAPGRPDRFMEAVQKKYLAALEAILVAPLVQEFSVPMVGFFNKNQDLVDLSFQYECDPSQDAALRLRSVLVRLEDQRVEITLGNADKLPHVLKVYLLLKEACDLRKELLKLKQANNLDHECAQELDRVRSKGR